MSAVVHSVSKSSRSLAQKPARLLRRMNASIFWRSLEVVKPTQALDA